MQSQLICIGHTCHDLLKDGVKLGGTVSYASIFGIALGAQTQIITSFGDDFQFKHVFDEAGIKCFNLPSAFTTRFQNTQGRHRREQVISNRAANISNEFVTQYTFPKSGIVHLGPIANEVEPSIAKLFPGCTVGLSIQGWLRSWDDHGIVFTEQRDWQKLQNIQLVFASEEDLDFDEKRASEIASHVPILVLTKGNKGADVYFQNDVHFFPSFPVKEVDTTGAGDVFALGFLWSFHQTNNVKTACIFAHSLASLLVEGHTLSNPPNREQINNRVVQYKLHFNI